MSATPVKIVLSREAAGYIRSGTPKQVKLQAVRGDLRLALSEWITVLYLLSQDPDDDVSKTANLVIRQLPFPKVRKALDQGIAPPVIDMIARERSNDKALLLEIINRPEVSDETIAYLATLPHKPILEAISKNSARVLRAPAILEALGTNPISSRAMVDKLLFLFGVGQEEAKRREGSDEQPEGAQSSGQSAADAAGVVNTGDFPPELMEEIEIGPDQKRLDQHNLTSMVKSLTVFQKIKLALTGNREARGILVRDRNKVVASAAIQNPQVSETEVCTYSKSKDICDDVLRLIAKNREWTKIYQVQLSLASNPKTPLVYAVRFLAYLKERDLGKIARSKDVPPQINAQARRLLYQKKGDA